MTRIKCLNAISPKGLAAFTKAYEIVDEGEADAYLVRSANLLEATFPESLKAIARAGAGVNNIPLDACAERGIVVFNTPGANANAVKEMVIAAILLSSRDIIGGIEWVKDHASDPEIAKDTESAKKAFAGSEILGKKVGVIGLGAVGILVANALASLGMDVYGYDPYISIDNAWSLSRAVKHVTDLTELYRTCEYLTIHVPLMPATKGMINQDGIRAMKPGMVLLNFARDTLVDEEALSEALERGQVACYVTDFPNTLSVKMKNAIVVPHLGASTGEAEDNCAVMAAHELIDYFATGRITHSVNFPALDPGALTGEARITILHHNVPNMIASFTSALQSHALNIANLVNKSRGGVAYTVLDLDVPAPEGLDRVLRALPDVLSVRVIR